MIDNQENKNVNVESLSKKIKHLDSVLRHISIVQSNTKLLGERLIEKGEVSFGVMLISNGLCHDKSKLEGIEWEYLTIDEENDEKLKLAHYQHVKTNMHHPEFWGGVEHMPNIYIAEMCCDWYARATEFGTDVREWFKNDASKRYNIKKNGKYYKIINGYFDMLLDKPFQRV